MGTLETKNQTVSIIIPVYNVEGYVERCIRSIMEQSYADLQIIVVDDGSTDGSAGIVEGLAAEDERILLIRQENAGVGAARNTGLAAATGKYLTFVDGDDYISPNYIRRYVRRMKETGATMLVGGLDFVTEEGKCIKRLVPDSYIRFEHEEWPMLVSAVCSHFYLKSLWDESGIRFGEAKERGEDVPISIYFAATCPKIDVLTKSGYYYVQRQSSATHNYRGLRTIELPYRSLENAIIKTGHDGIVNSREYHEVFVLRMLAMCAFDMARGASPEKKRELCDYINRILKTYYPGYARNPKARLCADTRFPFVQKAAVWTLVKLVRLGLLYPAIRFL